MEWDVLFKAVSDTSVATAIRESGSVFPWLESVHVLAVTLVVGSIAIVDLRLLGITSLNRAVSRVMKDVLPCTWIGFLVALITGLTLFVSNALSYSHNFYFQGKIILLALAGLNMLTFQFFGSKNIANWDASAQTPLAAKVASVASLALWISVVGFGRWIGFTLQPVMIG